MIKAYNLGFKKDKTSYNLGQREYMTNYSIIIFLYII